MPRTYIKKTLEKPKYDLEVLEAAIEAVKNGSSIYLASKTYSVPESTIRNRIKRNSDSEKQGPGRKQLIPKHIEDEIASHIIFLSDIQQPLTRAETASVVQEYFKVNKLPNPFSQNNDGPGKEWMMGFLQRHPEISKRKAQPLQKARAQCATRESFQKFFDTLGDIVKKHNIIKKPTADYKFR